MKSLVSIERAEDHKDHAVVMGMAQDGVTTRAAQICTTCDVVIAVVR